MGIWYQEFYLTTKKGEDDMVKALADPDIGTEARADISKRLDEMKQLDPGRCAISTKQIAFLERILNAAV